MSLLAPCTYDCYLHRLWTVDGRTMLDFTCLLDGQRYVLRVFPNQIPWLGIALIRHNGSILQVAGMQVSIRVDVKVDGDRAFNRVREITPINADPTLTSSVPTELPMLSFDEACD